MADTKPQPPTYESFWKHGPHGIEQQLQSFISATPKKVDDHFRAIHTFDQRLSESDVSDHFEQLHMDWYKSFHKDVGGRLQKAGKKVSFTPEGFLAEDHRREKIGDDLEHILESYMSLGKNVAKHHKQGSRVSAFEQTDGTHQDKMQFLQDVDDMLGVGDREPGLSALYNAALMGQHQTFDEIYASLRNVMLRDQSIRRHQTAGVSRLLRTVQGQHTTNEERDAANEKIYKLLSKDHQKNISLPKWRSNSLGTTYQGFSTLQEGGHPPQEIAPAIGYKRPDTAYPVPPPEK